MIHVRILRIHFCSVLHLNQVRNSLSKLRWNDTKILIDVFNGTSVIWIFHLVFPYRMKQYSCSSATTVLYNSVVQIFSSVFLFIHFLSPFFPFICFLFFHAVWFPFLLLLLLCFASTYFFQLILFHPCFFFSSFNFKLKVFENNPYEVPRSCFFERGFNFVSPKRC